MKTILKIFVTLIMALMISFGIWLGVNRWPQKVEPPLWTEADLAVTERKTEQNAYDLLLNLNENNDNESALTEASEAAQGSELSVLFEGADSKFTPNPASAQAYWKKAKALEPKLSSFLRENESSIKFMLHFFDHSELLDQDKSHYTSGRKNAPWMRLLNLHRLADLYIVERINAGDPDSAFQLWLKMFRQDLSHLNSARGMISNMVAIADVGQDLALLSQLRMFPPSPENQDAVRKILMGFNSETINFHRALVAEYLFNLSLVDLLGSGREGNFWLQISFNRAPIIQDINDRFRRLNQFAQEPNSINDETVRTYNEEMDSRTYKGLFWWFYNPAGKYLLRLTGSDILKYIREADLAKDKIQKMRAQLLNFPNFPLSPSPDQIDL